MLWVIDTVRERGSVEPPRLNDPDCKNATAKGGASACGAAGGDRTHDPWLRRPILYPLSYSRVCAVRGHYRTRFPCHGRLARSAKVSPL